MNVISCEIDGLMLFEPKAFGDARGFFMETWNLGRYASAGLKASFVQDNVSLSRRGILRGLHFQNPNSQGKLVSVLQGEVYDVAVDIRRQSPTFKKWCGVLLSSENHRQLFIPPGFAHGFLVVSETALFHYKCTDYYSPKDEMALRWNDPALGVEWPVHEPLLSAKDAAAPTLSELSADKLF